MTDILKYIKLGTSAKEWFNYDGKPLPIRPLSTYEIDEIMLKVLKEGISQTTFDALYKVKLNLIEPDEKVDVNQDNYTEFFYYFNLIDYWTVYFSMKDYQNEDFSKPDFDGEYEKDYNDWSKDLPKGYYLVRKMKFVHKMATDIRNMTSQPPTKLVEFLNNDDGKLLASMVFRFHQPLVSEAWKITPLQDNFLYYSRPGAPIMLTDESQLPGIKEGYLEDIVKALRKVPRQ